MTCGLLLVAGVSCQGSPRAAAPAIVPATAAWLPSSTSFPPLWLARPRIENTPLGVALPRPHRLWKKGGNRASPELKGAVFHVGSSDFRVTAAGVERRDRNSSRVIQLLPLAPVLQPFVGEAGGDTISDRGRTVMLLPSNVLVSWSTPLEPPLVLDAPIGMNRVVALRDDTLFLANEREDAIGAYDLANLDPPLASLSPDAAADVLREENASEDPDACDRLAVVEGLHDTFLQIAQRRSDPLWKCALQSLAVIARHGDGAVLRRLALEAQDYKELGMLASALAKDDDPETTALLIELATGHPPMSVRDAGMSEEGRREVGLEAAREQVWRTGRSSSVGWCPALAITRRAKELENDRRGPGIGTEHPLLFEAVSKTGSWCLLCQARFDTDQDGKINQIYGEHGVIGDDGRFYLVARSGVGWGIDELLAADEGGNYVAVRSGGCLSVVDLRARPPTITTLPGADLRDASSYGGHRSASFDAAGERLLYLRGGRAGMLVVRDLATGREKTRDPGPGLVWSAGFDPQGRWIDMTILPSDRWPKSVPPFASGLCSGTSDFSWKRDRPRLRGARRFISLGDGVVRDEEGLLSTFGNDFLRRTKDGAIVIAGGQPKEQLLVPAECGARLLHADVERRSVIVLCGGSQSSAYGDLWLFRLDGGYDLRKQVYVRDADRPSQPARRVVLVAGFYIDMDAARIVRAPPLAAGEVRPITDSELRRAGVYAERGDGQVLRIERIDERGFVVPGGPLRWRSPD
jgi:hypothetical protein